MKKYITPTIKIFLSLLILFSFSTIVKAQDYEFIIITPSKYETVARSFLTLHNDGSAWTIRGVYATVEDIFARYDQFPDGIEEPQPADAPGVPTLGDDQIGETYTNDVSLSIIKFLRGILLFRKDGQEDDFLGATGRREFQFAFDVLRDATGAPIFIGYERAKFKYLLLLGETGAAGPISVTLNGVPESWYVYMDQDTYGAETGPDMTYFPTDFFYSSPDYYDGVDWTPNLIVGRIPVHNFNAVSDSGTVTEVLVVDPADIVPTPPYTPGPGLVECDVCDTPNSWAPDIWVGYDLWIVSDGVPPEDGGLAPVGATYLILSNTDTCLRVLGDLDADGVEGETEAGLGDGDGYEIRATDLIYAQAMYNKCAAYDAEVKLNPSNAWNNWFRKVVTVGGDSYPYLFSFWDEFVLADITNEGYFEGNEIVKLRHTNKDNVPTDDDFTVTSLAPYLNDTDCGLIFHLGAGDADELLFDDAIMDTTLVLGYTSADSRIPIVVSNSGWYWDGSGRFDMPFPFAESLSFGAAVVESAGNGGGIAFIGSTDIAYSGIMPFFDNGVVYQDRLFNMDELLSYTMESFHSAPKYIGDIFTGSPLLLNAGGGPINEFIANNPFEANSELYWYTQKTVFEYILLGDPCLPVPYPSTETIVTGTSAPGLAFNESTLRSRLPLYESHGIGVDEMLTGQPGSTTVNITTTTPVNYPVPVALVKKTKVDIRRDTAVGGYSAPAAPASYTFATPNNTPGYYFIRVEQPGIDPNTSTWGSWWEKESWIYVQEVNQFTKTNNILVVDDDFGYPIVTTDEVYGFEDWYLRTLELLPQSYDIWHVDFDDNLFNTVWLPPDNGTGDDWIGPDLGSTQMHGEVYANLLANYDKVIWLTGDFRGYWRPMIDYDSSYWAPTEGVTIWNLETLTLPEQQYLTSYLNNYGRLFLSGQGILWDLGCSGLTEGHAGYKFCERKSDSFPISNTFLTGSLHITDLYSAVARGYHPQLEAISGNSVISGGYTLNIAGADGAENQYIFVDAEPNVDTPIVSRVFEYSSLSGAPEDIGDTPFFGTAGTAYYRGVGAHVFLPWGFEAINNQIKRNQVMSAILSWLGDNAKAPTGAGEEDGDGDGDGDDDGSGGVSGDGGSLSGCFVATACYGTPMAEEVRILSNFRDEYLMTNSLGRIFVRNYYKFSPQLAGYISERPALKKFIRTGLGPLVRFSEKLVVSKEE